MSTVASEAGVSGAIRKNHGRRRKKAGKKQPQDPFASSYGQVPFKQVPAGSCAEGGDLGEAAAGRSVVLFGTVQAVRPVSRMTAVVVLLHYLRAARCVVAAGAFEGTTTTRTVRFAATLPRQTIVIVDGVVSLPRRPTDSSTLDCQVEIQVRKLHAVSFSDLSYPIKLEDAARDDGESRKAGRECAVCAASGIRERAVLAAEAASSRTNSALEFQFL